MTFNISRRSALFLVGGAAISPTFPSFALKANEAEAFVGKAVNEVNALIKSGKSPNELSGDFERLFSTYFNLPIIARSAIGVSWRSASNAQKKNLQKALVGYVARKYGKQFDALTGGNLRVTGSEKTKRGYGVSTLVQGQSGAEVELVWQVSDRGGKTLVFDIYTEGVSMLVTERSIIGSMLDRRNGDLDRLIAHLNTVSS